MGGTPPSTHRQEARNPEKAPVSPLPHRLNSRLESVPLAQQHESTSEIPAATQMKRRIFGLENEYGLTCTLNGERRMSPDNVARYLFEKVIPGAQPRERLPRERRAPLPRHRVPPRVRDARVR